MRFFLRLIVKVKNERMGKEEITKQGVHGSSELAEVCTPKLYCISLRPLPAPPCFLARRPDSRRKTRGQAKARTGVTQAQVCPLWQDNFVAGIAHGLPLPVFTGASLAEMTHPGVATPQRTGGRNCLKTL